MFGGDDVALVLADVGERPDPGDVADRPQALAGAEVVVDRDALGAGLDADGLEAEPVDARATTRGHQETFAAHLGPSVELDDELAVFVAHRRGLRADRHLDAVPAQRLAQRLAQRRRLAGAAGGRPLRR